MVQTPKERRAAQRRLAKQIREGTYQPSPIGAKARQAARAATAAAEAAAAQQAEPISAKAARILRYYQADDAWSLAEEQMGGSPVDTYGPPVHSINPRNPRISMMQYWRNAQMVKVWWGDGGTPYVYFEIPPALWTQWKLTASPGRFINRNLAGKPYMPAPF